MVTDSPGKVTNMRVVTIEYDIPKIEVTILQNGLLRGVEITSIVVPVHRGG